MATFGETGTGNGGLTGYANTIYGSHEPTATFTLGEDGVIESITVRVRSRTGAAVNGKALIYDISASNPDAKKITSGSASIGTVMDWVEFTGGDLPYTYLPSGEYYISVIADGDIAVRRSSIGGGNIKRKSMTYCSEDDPFGSPTSDPNIHACAYATYSAYTPPTPAVGGGKSLINILMLGYKYQMEWLEYERRRKQRIAENLFLSGLLSRYLSSRG